MCDRGSMWAILVALACSLWTFLPSQPVRADESPTEYYAGWAVEAYPEQSAAAMEAILRRMVEHGANVVWIGHNNPGEVDAEKVEPGLSYAVYEAILNPGDPRHTDAMAIAQAQHRMLAACRAVGIQVVLPIGYQIQMGQIWNERHPGDLRRDAQGQPLNIYGGGVSASFYSPNYRRDIESYYGWIDAEFVRPYADILVMLNLADEPIGGDYSLHADAEFRRQVGFGFDDVGEDTVRQRKLGEFQSRYVAEYASYSALLWQKIHPGLPITMSFDGGQARKAFTMPDVEALFRDTPPNFVVTFDAYPRDGLPDEALSDQNLVGLFLLARSLGLYSAQYEKPVWIWAAANSWGLGQASPDPGTVSDAVANGLYLSLLVRQGGGDLRGIAFWNYNVKEQGLYNDTHTTAYDPEVMFGKVSASLHVMRRLMASTAGRPDVLIFAPSARSYELIGVSREAVRLEVQPYGRLSMLAKAGVNAAVVSSLEGYSLDDVQAIVILSPGMVYISAEDEAIVRDLISRGGKVVASPEVGAALAGSFAGTTPLVYGDLVEQKGNLLVAQKGIAVLFEDKRHDVLFPFWHYVLGLQLLSPGYRVVADRFAFYYHLGPDPALVKIALPFEAVGYKYNDEAGTVAYLRDSRLGVTLGRREYILMERVNRSKPWIE